MGRGCPGRGHIPRGDPAPSHQPRRNEPHKASGGSAGPGSRSPGSRPGLTQTGAPALRTDAGGRGGRPHRRPTAREAPPPGPQPSAPPPATHACPLCCPVTCPALAHTARGTRPGGPAATCAGDRGQRRAGCRPHGPRPPRGPLPSGGRRIIRSCRELPRSAVSDKALTMPAAARTAASTGRTRPRCAGREPAATASPSL